MSASSQAVPTTVEMIDGIISDIMFRGLPSDNADLVIGLLGSLCDGMKVLAAEVNTLESSLSSLSQAWDEGYTASAQDAIDGTGGVNPYA